MKPKITPESLTAQLNEAQALLNTKRTPATPVQPTVSANTLATPPMPVTVPTPALPTIPSRMGTIVNNVQRDAEGFISADTEARRRRDELQETFGALNEQGSLADMMAQQRQDLGIDTNIKELKDIQLQLTDANTASDLTKTRIEGAAGQTLAQGQREVTQEDRENAVRNSGLAARAAVLQGNIETATALAKDTVNLAFQDRQLTAQNLIQQINMVQSQVDEQTAQLLETEKRGYEAELASIKELKDNIANAMVNGASQSEIAQLNDPTIDDATKLTLAQSITARGANQMRNLEMGAKSASIRASNASAALNELQMQKQQQIDEAVANGAVILDDNQRKDAYALGKDFEAEAKDFKVRVAAFNQITTAAESATPAGDISLVYGYMKMLDPNSVVRETEFATAENAGGVPERVRALYNKALSGTLLTEDIRNDFVTNATNLYNTSLEQQIALEDRYKDKAINLFNLPPQAADLVVQDIRAEGAVSEVVFGLNLNNASDEQLADLQSRGLIPAQ